MAKTIRQHVTFAAKPRDVYEMLMDSRKHARFTGSKASISRKIGGCVRCYDGYIEAVNIALIPNRKIVQLWHASDWPEGVSSRVTFSLTAVKGGTHLQFTHAGVPDEQAETLKQGWMDFYWMPMKAALEDR